MPEGRLARTRRAYETAAQRASREFTEDPSFRELWQQAKAEQTRNLAELVASDDLVGAWYLDHDAQRAHTQSLDDID